MSDARSRVPVALLAVVALTLALLAGPLARPAAAEGTASGVVVEASVRPDGTITVKQTITFDGTVPETVTQRLERTENLVGDRQYVQTFGEVSATSGGQDLSATAETKGDFTTITVPTGGASDAIVVSYQVTGAVVNGTDGPAVRFRVLQGWSFAVDTVQATVAIPGGITYVRCTAGAPNSTAPCGSAAGGTEDAQVPTFTDGPRGEGEVVAVDIGVAAGTVAVNEDVRYRWTVARAFSADPLPLGLAIALLVLGGVGLVALHRSRGVDRSAGSTVTAVGEFAPVGDGRSEFRVVGEVRPGHVGTVLDERVDPIDVTATLLDLAVRGHVLITELPREGEFSSVDWTLSRQSSADPAGLRPFEQRLLDGVLDEGGEVRVSQLPDKVHGVIGDIQSALYDEVVAHGWFERRPDATRNRWTQWGLGALIVAIVVVGVLAAFTTFGLVGVALLALALGLVFVGQEMPARTSKGSALLAGLLGLRSQLLSQPTDQMPPGAELREFSEVLPYAVVLGGVDRWLDAIVAADTDEDPDSTDLSWYHGPATWHLRDLPASLKNFVTTTSGTLFSR